MNEKLTIEQEKLVTDNMKLVYYHVNKLQVNPFVINNKDDLVSEGMKGLIKAARTFDPTKCKFATYSTRCILNEIFMFMRKNNKRGPNMSLSMVIGTEDGSELTLGDTELLADNSMREQIEHDEVTCIKQQMLEAFLSKCRPREREVIDLLGKGKKQAEVAMQLGLSQSYVSRIFQKFKDKFGKYRKRNEDFYAA